MDCPRCNQALTRIDQSRPGTQDTKRVFYCEHCGWGKEQLEKKESADIPVSGDAPNPAPYMWLKLGGLWIVSAALVVVPYLLLVHIPSLFSGADPAIFDAEAATARMVKALNPMYWVIVGTYVAICATFQSPDVDWNDMGWLGGLVNNPFAYSDNINRQKFVLLLMMMPGKIIVVTLTATYRLIRAAF